MSQEIERIRQIKNTYEAGWLKIPEVTAIGIGFVAKDEYGLIISLKTDSEKIRKKIPMEVDGIKIKINVTGEIKAF